MLNLKLNQRKIIRKKDQKRENLIISQVRKVLKDSDQKLILMVRG